MQSCASPGLFVKGIPATAPTPNVIRNGRSAAQAGRFAIGVQRRRSGTHSASRGRKERSDAQRVSAEEEADGVTSRSDGATCAARLRPGRLAASPEQIEFCDDEEGRNRSGPTDCSHDSLLL